MKSTLLCLMLMVGQTVTPPPTTPPVISDAQRAAYWKAQAELQQAQASMQQRQAAMQQAVQAITEACGKDFAPSIDAKGEVSLRGEGSGEVNG